jgi:hypothetical protein
MNICSLGGTPNIGQKRWMSVLDILCNIRIEEVRLLADHRNMITKVVDIYGLHVDPPIVTSLSSGSYRR